MTAANYATPESIDWEASWALMKERAESAERRIAAVEALLEKLVYLRIVHQGWSEEDYSRPLVEANAIRAALHPVAETAAEMTPGEAEMASPTEASRALTGYPPRPLHRNKVG